jgi:hypothetical protein
MLLVLLLLFRMNLHDLYQTIIIIEKEKEEEGVLCNN